MMRAARFRRENKHGCCGISPLTWQPPESHAGLLLFRGMEPQRRWRPYATLLLDVAARCGVQWIVSRGALLAAVPHPDCNALVHRTSSASRG